MKHIHVEGWRGINHSYAMVNQYQLLELIKHSELTVTHQDCAFPSGRWSTTTNNPHFPAEMRHRIEAIPNASGQAVDTVLRIAAPFERSATKARKVLTFMTAEGGLGPENFPSNAAPITDLYSGNAAIVCPSKWSRMKLEEYGIPAERIAIVPHGVHPDIFFQVSESERNASRVKIGLQADQHVFLNLGAMSVNKGIDLLLRAFFEVRKRYPHARLILKDERNLYGLSGVLVVQDAMRRYPHLSSQEMLDSIKLLSVTLPLVEMRDLYGMANTYVSPYRAEGFNLPVIEAMACGTPVIVTAGGATDDFCEPRTSIQVPSSRKSNAEAQWSGSGYHLEPDMEALIAAMQADIEAPRANTPAFKLGHAQLIQDFSWSACVQRLTNLF